MSFSAIRSRIKFFFCLSAVDLPRCGLERGLDEDICWTSILLPA